MGLAIFAGATRGSMTYQTANSLRRSRRKSHIPFYRSSHLSKSKSITGAGATNGYRMFSTWYPSAIDDYRNARLGYKAWHYCFRLQDIVLRGAFEATNNLYGCVCVQVYVILVYLYYRCVYRTGRNMSRALRNTIYWTCYVTCRYMLNYKKM